MGAQNKICDALEDIKEAKQNILDKIKNLKSICAGAPNFIIDTSLPSININFAVLHLLQDIMALLGNTNLEEIKALILNWLNNVIGPLSKRIKEILKQKMKDCFTCKIGPAIPPWLFLNNPNDGTIGNGLNFQLEQIDLQCLFKINPSTEMGELLYDNYGMNYFLWETIQAAGTKKIWLGTNGQPIAHFTFLESDPTAYTESTTPGGVQNILTTNQNNVFKIQIDNRYHNKSLTTFNNDYIDSISPVFDVSGVISKAMDIIYGVLGKGLNLSDPCAEKIMIFQNGIEKLINNGVDDPDVVIDNTFFEFNEPELVNIKEQTSNYKRGYRPFSSCCNKRVASIDPSTLIEMGRTLKDPAASPSSMAGALEEGVSAMQHQSTQNVDALDRNKANLEFIGNLINSIGTAMSMLVFTPKINIQLMTIAHLSQNASSFKSTPDFFQFFICIIRGILGELLKKLIYEFLIPYILRNLRPLILCLIGKLIKEAQGNHTLSLDSLLPTNQLMPDGMKDKIKKAMGKAKTAYDKVEQVSNNLNVAGGLDLLKGDKDSKGKFCD